MGGQKEAGCSTAKDTELAEKRGIVCVGESAKVVGKGMVSLLVSPICRTRMRRISGKARIQFGGGFSRSEVQARG